MEQTGQKNTASGVHVPDEIEPNLITARTETVQAAEEPQYASVGEVQSPVLGQKQMVEEKLAPANEMQRARRNVSPTESGNNVGWRHMIGEILNVTFLDETEVTGGGGRGTQPNLQRSSFSEPECAGHHAP